MMKRRATIVRATLLNALITVSACGPTPNPPPPLHFTPHKFAGTAELHWQPPAPDTGDPSANRIDGFYIHYGTDEQASGGIIEVADPSATTFMVHDLPPGTYHFQISAYGPNGEGRRSESVSKTVVE
jgi:hypothetical protein